MRLINTNTLEMHEFFDSQIPGYAILSHRWEDGEISYKDFVKRRNLDAPGWRKVRTCCDFVRKRGHEFVWIDTCCIDKRSSAELSEAINSMYRWYENSEMCYAYLNDVHCTTHTIDSSPDIERQFRASEWFKRGWTLQELLAPRGVAFVDKTWKWVIGSKYSLRAILSSITGISEHAIHFFHKECYSVAQILSWAAQRVCMRAEDTAYCLMGLFRVNLPLLYGEGGAAAFRRLQLKILEDSNDESIFAWNHSSETVSGYYGSILAGSPKDFRFCADIYLFDYDSWLRKRPYYKTNSGLALETILPVLEETQVLQNHYYHHFNEEMFWVPLRCFRVGKPTPLALVVHVSTRSIGMRTCYRVPPRKPYNPSLDVPECPKEYLDQTLQRFIGETERVLLQLE